MLEKHRPILSRPAELWSLSRYRYDAQRILQKLHKIHMHALESQQHSIQYWTNRSKRWTTYDWSIRSRMSYIYFCMQRVYGFQDSSNLVSYKSVCLSSTFAFFVSKFIEFKVFFEENVKKFQPSPPIKTSAYTSTHKTSVISHLHGIDSTLRGRRMNWIIIGIIRPKMTVNPPNERMTFASTNKKPGRSNFEQVQKIGAH